MGAGARLRVERKRILACRELSSSARDPLEKATLAAVRAEERQEEEAEGNEWEEEEEKQEGKERG